MERMLEAARQEYWHANPATVDELKARYQDLAARFDVHSDNARFLEYVATGVPAAPAAAPPPAHEQASSEPAGAPPAAPERPQADQPTEQVSGMRLEKASDGAAADDHALFAALALLLLAFGSGALRQAWPPSRRGRRATVNRTQ